MAVIIFKEKVQNLGRQLRILKCIINYLPKQPLKAFAIY